MIGNNIRPAGWPANPQAMAATRSTKTYDGHPELGAEVDPDTWLTPRWILDQLGAFDLDPCAAAVTPAWVGAARAYTKDVDGLSTEWGGRVFMNPPFSDTRPWIRKHSEHGQGISLIPAALESRVWHECVWAKAKALLLLAGRTRFANPDGSTTTGRPLRSIALIAWSDADAAVLAGSGMAGVLLTEWKRR
jgi:hypothetical protein